jgi:hypothetical protein
MIPVAAPQPGAYRPVPGGRSPLRAALRAHLYLAVIVVVLVVAAVGSYWVLRVHQRIDRAALQNGVASRQASADVRCVSRQSNGSVWNCAVVYSAESVCLIASVNPLGDWSTSDGRAECQSVPELASFAPTPRAGKIAADLDRLGATTGSTCAKIPGTDVRWACLVGGRCVRVRAVRWAPLKQDSVAGLCDRKAIKRALHA